MSSDEKKDDEVEVKPTWAETLVEMENKGQFLRDRIEKTVKILEEEQKEKSQ